MSISLLLGICMVSLREALGGALLRGHVVPAMHTGMLRQHIVPALCRGKLRRHLTTIFCSAEDSWKAQDVFIPSDADEDLRKTYIGQWTNMANFWASASRQANTGFMATLNKFTLKGKSDSARELAQELRREADQLAAAAAASAPKKASKNSDEKRTSSQQRQQRVHRRRPARRTKEALEAKAKKNSQKQPRRCQQLRQHGKMPRQQQMQQMRKDGRQIEPDLSH
eukprot:gnl/TRDRNA2_/TRDRNA2_169396_c1_seq1.p1 gnl/TRDRNA2_/TRDRNA2_169396_c1~~gnl/TRDRNA2_/TRDRNA2_169396_c1_seq1.p1  ORF type:complete len:225 (+),score=39.91 gnl/TRDRNA2_/TRDRNA2_169396_c1_seq1:67-741(+)